MKTYVKTPTGLQLKCSSDSSGITSIQLHGVITSDEIKPKDGKFIIPTTQFYSNRGLKGVSVIQNSDPGNYKVANFRAQYSNSLSLNIYCGMILNYRWDISFRKNNPSIDVAPGNGQFIGPSSTLTVYNGDKYNSSSYTVGMMGVKIVTYRDSNQHELYLMNVPRFHTGLVEITISGENASALNCYENSKIENINTSKGLSHLNVDGIIITTGQVPLTGMYQRNATITNY
jgi:hypothetical protein